MEATEHNFTSTQPLHQLPNRDKLANLQDDVVHLRLANVVQRPPRTLLEVATRLTQTSTAIALTMPVLCGAILAWWEWGALHGLILFFNLASVLTLALGMNVLAGYCDYMHAQNAATTAETPVRPEPLMTGYGLMANGIISPGIALNLAYWLLTASVLCSLWLTLLVGWPILFFSTLSFMLAYTYAHPPIQYSYRGWALGEIGIFLGYGLLPIVGSYYSQSHILSSLSIWVSIPLGFLSTLIFFNYNFIYEYRDWLMHKRTLVVNMNTPRALDVSSAATLAVYIAILCIVSLAHLPLSTLVTLAVLPTALGVFPRLRRRQITIEDRFLLYRTTVNAAIWTGLLFSIALITDKLL